MDFQTEDELESHSFLWLDSLENKNSSKSYSNRVDGGLTAPSSLENLNCEPERCTEKKESGFDYVSLHLN